MERYALCNKLVVKHFFLFFIRFFSRIILDTSRLNVRELMAGTARPSGTKYAQIAREE